jgi:hypothetical protein
MSDMLQLVVVISKNRERSERFVIDRNDKLKRAFAKILQTAVWSFFKFNLKQVSPKGIEFHKQQFVDCSSPTFLHQCGLLNKVFH